jgi:EAL domain-containing protein (putative c-di-GMP-specific phosphodiesterase class I)
LSLLRDADDAMYQSKSSGRNCFTVLDHLSKARGHRRQSIAAALPDALERNEFHLEYQPVVHMRTGAVAGFEALIRWDHPTIGAIMPDEFISLAEHTGLIIPIGSWVLRTALEQLATWRSDPRLPADLWMALNVSAHQLSQPRFVEEVSAVVSSVGVAADAVHLEITESILMNRIDDALRIIGELQATGINVSIDDFGTGYSSLSYLSQLPVNTIKIDRSFVSSLGTAGHTTSIVRAMMTLANALDLVVVAEGVELTSQLDLLESLGCAFGQGFLWSRSLTAGSATWWMIEHADQAPPAERPMRPGAGLVPCDDTDPARDVGQAIVEIALVSGRRRRAVRDLSDVVRLESLEIGMQTRRLWVRGREIELTDKEFDLLAFLAMHRGEVFDRAVLLREVWNSSPEWQTAATVTEHIHRLRHKIESDPTRPALLCTVRNRGYRLGTLQAAS